MKELIRSLSPPILVQAGKRVRDRMRAPEWEYVPEGWPPQGADERIRGWGAPAIVRTNREKWPAFMRSVEGAGPLGVAHEATSVTRDLPGAHNTVMSYGYVLALASWGKSALSMLDWGGGLGHYYVIGKALLPDVDIAYHCKDLPDVSSYGRELFPEAHFYEDESCFERSYDLVFASSSLHYSEDWGRTLEQLAGAASSYLYVTRLPIVSSVPSFVVVQRPNRYGYETEYLGWFLNRDEFLQHASDAGMTLVREFIVMEDPVTRGAPEQAHYRGFLFRPGTAEG